MKLLIITKKENDLSLILSSSCEAKILAPEKAEYEDILSFDAMAILGGTDSKPMMLNPYLRSKAEGFAKSGKPIFLEFVPSFSCIYSAQPTKITSHRLVSVCDLSDEIKCGDLLDSRHNDYIRPHFLMPDTKALMYYHQYTPAHDKLNKEGGELVSNDIALFSYGNVLFCSFRMCDYLKAAFAPVSRWNSLVEYICEFLGIEKPKEFAKPSYTAKGKLNGDFFEELKSCTDNSLALLKNYLVTPDGKYGIREGLSHNILPDGTRLGADYVRTDCTGEAAGAFFFSFDDKLKQIAENMYSLCYGPLTVHDGEYDGMVRWTEEAWEVCYQDDVARAIIPSLLLDYFGISDKYRSNAHNALKFLCETTCKDGLRPARTDVLEFMKSGKPIRSLTEEESGLASAHYNAYYSAALLLGYITNGNEEFKAVGVRGLETLMSKYPETVREHSETSELCRLILPLAILFKATGEEKHKEMLYRVFNDLQNYKHESGGFAEWDTGYKASCFNNAGGECSLLAQNGDNVADLLYSLNWLPLGFALAWQITGDGIFYTAWQEICEFFIKAQLVSENELVNGGWCRGIDLDRLEYCGIPHDVGWGPCCIETGWTVAEITMGMLVGKALKEGKIK